MRKMFVASLIACISAGCSLESDRVCTQNIEFGLWVHVNDRINGAPLHDVRGQVRSGSFSDSLMNDGAGDGVYIAAAEKPGTYSMHLEQQGYAPFDTTHIVVKGGGCHVVPTVLYVTLVPAP